MEKVKRVYMNLPITVSFMLFIIVFILIASLLSIVTLKLTNGLAYDLAWSYYNSDIVKKIVQEDGSYLVEGDIDEYFSPKDKFLYLLYQALPGTLIFIYVVVCLVAAPILFYKIKMKKPFDIIISSSEKISNNDLNFEIDVNRNDEMGKICQAIEKMRFSLEKNNREMWRAMEERKKLNAAFSHDLRTPITVLRGYTDLMLKYLPEDKIPKDKILSHVLVMNEHILRLEDYINSMNSIQKLEDIELKPHPYSIYYISNSIEEVATVVSKGKRIEISPNINETYINIDFQLIMKVFENIITNAVEYAKEKIFISCEIVEDMFILVVEDDGDGFSPESLEKGISPFYSERKKLDNMHLGLGLNICKIIIEKHEGQLLLQNGTCGGARVTAKFKIFN